jgi:hypothetical protein
LTLVTMGANRYTPEEMARSANRFVWLCFAGIMLLLLLLLSRRGISPSWDQKLAMEFGLVFFWITGYRHIRQRDKLEDK